mgnify:CR=1 FL=1
MEKLLALVGPTAVGKTKMSIRLAKKINGEVISGDSMQVYRGMDIGTAKIKPEEMEGIPHHMIDILDPDEAFSVSQFQRMATELITQINRRQAIPLLVGGTGLYVQSVTHQFRFPEKKGSAMIRQKWKTYLAQHGPHQLHEALRKRDPEYARTLHPHNTRRIIRALEIWELTGQSMREYQQDWHKESPYDLIMIGLTMERSTLYERINRRVDQMVKEGLIEETERIIAKGIPEDATALQAIGYKEIIQYLKGRLSKEEAIALLKRNTRRFAKRQFTWFRRMKEIHWFDLTEEKGFDTTVEKIWQLIAGEWQLVKNI